MITLASGISRTRGLACKVLYIPSIITTAPFRQSSSTTVATRALLESPHRFPQSSSPAQRGLPQKEPPPSLHQAAPRSGSSLRRSPLFRPPFEQPRAAAAPPEAASPVPQSSSHAQRQLFQNEPHPSLNQAATRSGSSSRTSLLRPSIEQPHPTAAPL